jgi:predicted RNA binding protein YcfA (HicA-like mRNA interferase family)
MKLPVIKPRQAIKAFQRAGWYVDHQTGSHNG